jgi:hypothetical protein
MTRSRVGGLLFIGGTPRRLAAFGISDEPARLTAPGRFDSFVPVSNRLPPSPRSQSPRRTAPSAKAHDGFDADPIPATSPDDPGA